MTQEEIRDEVDRLQGLAKAIKEQVSMLRNDVCSLQGCVNRSIDKEVDKKLASIEKRAYQTGYANGLAEGCKQAEDSCEGCANAEKPMSALLCLSCRRRYPDKYQQAGEPDDEIRVGTEVELPSGKVGKVFSTDSERSWVLLEGEILLAQNEKLRKTGNHFPELEKMLEVLR